MAFDESSSAALSSLTGLTFSDMTPTSIEVVEMKGKRQEQSLLFGREREIAVLQDSFIRMQTEEAAAARAVFVHGYSGTGKTRLVEVALRNFVLENGGHFISGKFNQMKMTGESLSALSAAFSDLCELFLSTWDNKQLEILRTKIQANIGSEARTLARLIPNLHYILPELSADVLNATATTEMRPSNADQQAVSNGGQNSVMRMKQLCTEFMWIVATHDTPLVLFIDDLQWADTASVDMITHLLSSENLLVILGFRDSDISSSSEPVGTWRSVQDFISSLNVDLHGALMVETTSLDESAIQDMLATLLAVGKEETAELSKLTHQRTHGNPFFVEQFFAGLKRLHLLFKGTSGKWEWDVTRIESLTRVSENVVGLVTTRIEALHLELQRILKIASFLGHTFDIELLQATFNQIYHQDSLTSDATSKAQSDENSSNGSRHVEEQSGVDMTLPVASFHRKLKPSVDAGLLEKIGQSRYRFSHDHIQNCLLSREQDGVSGVLFHLVVGNALAAIRKNSAHFRSDDSVLFLATDHLNFGSGKVKDSAARIEIVELNLAASVRSLELCFFVASTEYLQRSLRLLDQVSAHRKWESHYELTLKASNMQALLEFCNGNFEQSIRVAEFVISKAKTVGDRLDAYTTIVKCYSMQDDKLQKAVQLGVEVCILLGEPFPKICFYWHIGKELLQVRKVVNRLTDEGILSLAPMKRMDKAAVIEVLSSTTYASFLDEKSRIHYVITSLRMMSLTANYGSTTWTPAILSRYGAIEAIVGNRVVGKRFLDLSCKLLKGTTSNQVKNRCLGIMHGMLSLWFVPFVDVLNGLKNGYILGMQCGDFNYALYTACQYVPVGFNSSVPLSQLESDATIFCEQMRDFNLLLVRNMTLPICQAIRNLHGRDEAEDPAELCGSVIPDVGAFESDLKRQSNKFLTFIFNLSRLGLALAFRKHQLMEHICTHKFAKLRNEMCRGHFASLFSVFAEGEASYILYYRTGLRKYRKMARQATMELAKFQDVPMCAPCALALKAEEVAMKDSKCAKKESVIQLFEEAIAAAAVENRRQIMARTSERAFNLLDDKYHDLEAGRKYLQRALTVYKEWEAFRKVRWLEENYPI